MGFNCLDSKYCAATAAFALSNCSRVSRMTDLRPCHLRLDLSLIFILWSQMWVLVVLQVWIVLSIVWNSKITIVCISAQIIAGLVVRVIVQRIVVISVVSVQLIRV